MKRILITGAAGFIGFHTAGALEKRGDFVIGLDNFNDYYDPKLKRDRAAILHEKNITIIDGDITNQKLLSSLIKEHKITHVLHLAAQAGVRYSITNPDSYIASNLVGFVSILEAIKEDPSIKLVYASSSSVYGLNKKTPFAETDLTDQPSNFYGATKKANELIAHSYHHLYHNPMIGLRFFTVYGPFGRPDMAYFSFTKDILQKKTIKIFNFGKMKRDFTYIDDIVTGILSSLDIDKTFEVYNLGNNKPCQLMDMIQTLEKLLESKAEKEMLPMQKGEVLVTYANIDKSAKDLGFSPKTSLDKGLEYFVNWYLAYHG